MKINISKIINKPVINRYYRIFYFTMVETTLKLNFYDDTEQLLKKEGIEYHLQSHEAVKTANEYADLVKCEKNYDFQFIKNLVYKSKSGKFVYYALLPEQKMETKVLEAFSEQKNLRAAEESHLVEHLNVKPGSVNPLCLLNLKEKDKFIFIIDSSINKEYVAIHPMINTHTIWVKRQVLLSYLEKNGVKVITWDSDNYLKKFKAQKEVKKEKVEEKKKDPDHELNIQYDKITQFPDWYVEVIGKSEMIDYYDISGCYILRPWAYSIWDQIHQFFDSKIKGVGVENCYFPMFVSQDVLEKEKNHVEGFSPEVAWVTHYGDKALDKKIAIRPTSETIMYPLYSKWIRSHRDLPLLLNQWANVVRWEFKHPTPFIRTREFLWQEGHTAHESEEETDKFVVQILDFYRDVYEELLAVPVIQGFKSENEKFAGALRTTTIETLIPENGKAIQCATSHNLGQNFSKMFGITYSDKNQKEQHVWQASWGLTTRTIGVCVMVHGDNKGLILPPRVAPIQIVLIPILSVKDKTTEVVDKLYEIYKQLKNAGIRCKVDDDTVHTGGFKFNHWERKGVPLRIEFGRKDLEKDQITIAFRDDITNKKAVPLSEAVNFCLNGLEEMQKRMLENARKRFAERRKEAKDFDTFHKLLNEKCAALTPWCTEPNCEDEVKKKIKNLSTEDENSAGTCKTLCVPFDQSLFKQGEKCFNCGKDAVKVAMWGRSY